MKGTRLIGTLGIALAIGALGGSPAGAARTTAHGHAGTAAPPRQTVMRMAAPRQMAAPRSGATAASPRTTAAGTHSTAGSGSATAAPPRQAAIRTAAPTRNTATGLPRRTSGRTAPPRRTA